MLDNYRKDEFSSKLYRVSLLARLREQFYMEQDVIEENIGDPIPFDVFETLCCSATEAWNNKRFGDFCGFVREVADLVSHPTPKWNQFASLLPLCPLCLILLDIFDAAEWLHLAPTIAQIFVNVTSIHQAFIHSFIEDRGIEKLMHVNCSVDPQYRPIISILSYNIFSFLSRIRIGETTVVAERLVEMLGFEDSPDSDGLALCAQREFLAPFVLVSLLRAGPIEKNEIHELFLKVMTICIPRLNEGPLQCAMWAVYFWFKHTPIEVQWNFITPEFVKSIKRAFLSTDEVTVRIWIWVWSFLWLIPDSKRFSPLIRRMRKHMPVEKVLEWINSDSPLVVSSALLLLSNFIGFDWQNLSEFSRYGGFESCARILLDGFTSCKREVVWIICLFLRRCERPVLNVKMTAELIQAIVEVLQVGDEVMTFFCDTFINLIADFEWILDVLNDCEFDKVLLGIAEEGALSQNGRYMYDYLLSRENGHR
jgi:hypothetical protein